MPRGKRLDPALSDCYQHGKKAARSAAPSVCLMFGASVLSNFTRTRFSNPIWDVVFGGEDILVVNDPVLRGKRICVTRVRPNGVSIVIHNGQAAIVAVKSGLDAIRRCKHGR